MRGTASAARPEERKTGTAVTPTQPDELWPVCERPHVNACARRVLAALQVVVTELPTGHRAGSSFEATAVVGFLKQNRCL